MSRPWLFKLLGVRGGNQRKWGWEGYSVCSALVLGQEAHVPSQGALGTLSVIPV